MFAKRTAAQALATFAAEASLRDRGFDRQLFDEKIGECLTPNPAPKFAPSFWVTINLSYRAITWPDLDPIFGVKKKARF